MLGIYVHIPFCRRKCGYCDFNSSYRDERDIRRYADRLVREIRQCRYGGLGVDTIFIGGGTPSFIGGEYIEEIMCAIRDTFTVAGDAEISIEVNPDSVSPGKLDIYKRAGINRVSMGVQSFADKNLRTLGRIHSAEKAEEAFCMIRSAGFENINIDLMFSYPYQTTGDWERTLEKAVSLDPGHISAYSLIIEENTPFYKKYKNYQTNEVKDRIMYRKANEILAGAGYGKYEISNFAKEGRQCRHNVGYWKRYDYLGFGLSAHSLFNNVRFANTDDFEAYMGENTVCYEERLSRSDIIGEYMFLGLRMTEGIAFADFEEEFGESVQSLFSDVIGKYKALGLLEYNGERLWLTEKGIDVSNTVFADFLL